MQHICLNKYNLDYLHRNGALLNEFCKQLGIYILISQCCPTARGVYSVPLVSGIKHLAQQ